MERATVPLRVDRFGPFELSRDAAELRRNGIRLKLQDHPFQILCTLLDHPGELVTREQLRQQLWPDGTFVDFEHGLYTAINRLRDVLNDDAEIPRYIETVPRRGYRFIGPIVSSETTAAVTESGKISSTKRGAKRIWMGLATAAVLTSIVAGFFWIRSPLPLPRVLRYAPLTSDRHEKNRACVDAFSRLVTDGTRVFFSERNSPVMQVSAAGGDVTKLSIQFECFSIRGISPDRTELIGTRSLLGNQPIWLLSTLSGLAQPVGNLHGHTAAWSPDGQRIAYAAGSPLDQEFDEVYVATRDGATSRKLTQVNGVIWSIVWSPDGRLIRMDVWKDDSVHVWEVYADGSNLQRLPITPKGNRVDSFGSWTADQKYFVFAANTSSGGEAIWALRERQSFFRRGPREPVQLTSGEMDFWQPITSPDGKRIFAIGGIRRGELIRYDSKLKRFAPYLSGISAEHLDFSRDGKWVTYVTFPEGILWRSREDGSDRMRLTDLPLRAYLPRWSPDGTQIAFAGKLPGEYQKIYLVSTDGGQPRVVAERNEHQTDPSWLPDGHTLIFGPAFFASHPQLYLLDLKTKRVAVVPGSDGLYTPLVSPDGRYIVAVETPGNQKLKILDRKTGRWFEGADFMQLGPAPVRWSNDNRYVYISMTSDKFHASWYRLRIADRKLEQLGALDVPEGRLGVFEPGLYLTPDGSPVVLRDMSIQEIYALDVELP